MKKTLLSIISFGLLFGLLPNVNAEDVCGSSTSENAITIKPQNISDEYISVGKTYKANSIQIVSGNLVDGDEFSDVVYGGSQTYVGKSASEIVSFKIMRGTVDVTKCYNVTLEKGEIDVYPFGSPVASDAVSVVKGKTISKTELDILVGHEGLKASHEGVGTYSLENGFTSTTVGEAKLTYTLPGVDKNGDGVLDIANYNYEVEITVFESNGQKYTITYDSNGGSGTMSSENDLEGTKILPTNKFSAPSGKQFLGWSLEKDGDIIFYVEMTANKTVYALWEDAKEETQEKEVFLENTEKQTFKPGKLDSYVIKIDEEHTSFMSLKVNDVLFVKDEDYTVTKGSTIITFTEKGLDKLNKLNEGNHEVKVEFTNNKVVSAKLNLSNSAEPSLPSNPQTLDKGIVNYIVLSICSLVGLVMLVLYKRKQTN